MAAAELAAWVASDCPAREIWIRLQGESKKAYGRKPKNDTT